MTLKTDHEQRARDIMAAMVDPNELVARFKGLFYGPSGVGKTVLAAAVAHVITPPDKKIIYVDTSEGWLVLRNNHPKLFEKISNVLPFQSLEHLQTLSLMIKGRAPGFEDVKTIILDEATKMASIDLLRVQNERNPEAEIPEWKDYNTALQRLRRSLDALYSTPDLNVILIGHEKDKKNDKGVVIRTYPSFNPEAAKEVKESLHLVAFCTADNKVNPANPTGPPLYERMAQVMPTGKIDAKTRIDKFSSVKVSHDEILGNTLDWLQRGGISVTPAPGLATEEKETVLPNVTSLQEMEEVADRLNLSGLDEIDTAPAWSE